MAGTIKGGLFASSRPTTRFYVGFDLGQKATPSAVVVVELVKGASHHRDPVSFQWIAETHLIFRKIERFPLNTPYDSLAQPIEPDGPRSG